MSLIVCQFILYTMFQHTHLDANDVTHMHTVPAKALAYSMTYDPYQPTKFQGY